MKKVLITGSSGGIGAATARLFAESGYYVALHYHQSEGIAHSLEQEFGEYAFAVKADISDSAQVKAMFSAVLERFGGIDVLINNAGIAEFSLFTDITDEQWRRMFAVNVDGCFYCCREALPYMISQKSGTIINVSSIWGITGGSCEVHYSASKAAVIGLTKALAKEVGPSGIMVNCIAPGIIDTKMNRSLSGGDITSLLDETPLQKIGTPFEIAKTALFLSESEFITGQVISPNGGFVI
ncbi:MAG TPA: 3-oxoacyl-ACP reductase FabG [Oscillospiraceae bacterium]|nr:3-oxoacyl-ACP reductase FabG [Oscillospiraceae bacterium]HPS35578.1 3-oxoacyl-ACP reductase FabG [Oscillospiraceae bacterium]